MFISTNKSVGEGVDANDEEEWEGVSDDDDKGTLMNESEDDDNNDEMMIFMPRMKVVRT